MSQLVLQFHEDTDECEGCIYAPYSEYKDVCVDCQAEEES